MRGRKLNKINKETQTTDRDTTSLAQKYEEKLKAAGINGYEIYVKKWKPHTRLPNPRKSTQQLNKSPRNPPLECRQ